MLFLKVFTQFMPLTFAWNSNVHLSLTATGLTDALGRLEQDGVLKSMGLSRGVVQAMFSWLGLYNTAEDVEYCNFNDKIDAKIIEWAKLPKYAPGITEYMADEIKKMKRKFHGPNLCGGTGRRPDHAFHAERGGCGRIGRMEPQLQ